MEELLKEKLKEAKHLKSFTEEILAVSIKTDHEKFDAMIDERQKYIERIDVINNKLKEMSMGANKDDSKEEASVKKEIREILKDVNEMDNTIRKSLQNELTSVKKSLNIPETSRTLNIKA